MHKSLKGLYGMAASPSPKTNPGDLFRNRLTFFLVGAFTGIIPLFVFWGMPETSKEIVTYMVGQLSGMALMALGYHFTRESNPRKGEENGTDKN